MPSEKEVLKALVDEALARGVHPDNLSVLEEWRGDNTSEEERRDRLTDDERAEEDRKAEAKRAESRKSTPPKEGSK